MGARKKLRAHAGFFLTSYFFRLIIDIFHINGRVGKEKKFFNKMTWRVAVEPPTNLHAQGGSRYPGMGSKDKAEYNWLRQTVHTNCGRLGRFFLSSTSISWKRKILRKRISWCSRNRWKRLYMICVKYCPTQKFADAMQILSRMMNTCLYISLGRSRADQALWGFAMKARPLERTTVKIDSGQWEGEW